MLSRSRELRADWISATIYGSQNFSSALTKVVQISSHFGEHVEDIALDGKVDFFEEYSRVLHSSPSKLEEYVNRAFAETEQDFDTHPTISTRIKSLPANEVVEGDESLMGCAEQELLEDEKRLSIGYLGYIKNIKEIYGKLCRKGAKTYQEQLESERLVENGALEEKTVERWLNEVNILIDSERYEEAMGGCDKIFEIDLGVGSAWYNKGVALNGLERYKEAIECFDRALEIDPMVAVTWYHKMDALANLKRYEEAQMCIDRARELDPDLKISKKVAMPAEEELKDHQSRIPTTPPNQIDGNAAEEWIGKGVALVGLERYVDAIGCYDKILEIDSEHVDAWFFKGHALANLGRYEEAIGCYGKALEIDPERAVVWFGKGSAFSFLGRDEEAIQCYDKALEINPEDAIVLGYKGGALFALERYEEAMECNDKALEIDSEYVSAWYGKGLALAALERREEAIRCFDRVLEIDSEYVDAWFGKGHALADLRRYEKAIGCFNKALEINPDLEKVKKSKMIAEEKLSEQQSITSPTPPNQIDGNAAEGRQ